MSKKDREGGPQVLYYALVLKHPAKKQSPVAVAEMVSSEHSILAVCHFLECFRRAEAMLYGYQCLTKPRAVVIDRSIVLLTSFLRVYNLETVDSYLDRCFRIVTESGDGDDETSGIFVLACISHVMKSAKKHFKKML